MIASLVLVAALIDPPIKLVAHWDTKQSVEVIELVNISDRTIEVADHNRGGTVSYEPKSGDGLYFLGDSGRSVHDSHLLHSGHRLALYQESAKEVTELRPPMATPIVVTITEYVPYRFDHGPWRTAKLSLKPFTLN